MIDDSQSAVVDIKEMKNQLFKELDNLLLETFHTTPVIIDEQKLVNGEEGCLCNIDLEYIDNDTKQGLVDTSTMLEDDKENILNQMNNIHKLL